MTQEDFDTTQPAEQGPERWLRMLATNAGWYATPETAADEFRDWAERYLAAFRGAGMIPWNHPQILSIAARTGAFLGAHVARFEAEDFARLVPGRRVLVISAFAEQIEAAHRSGRLARLWADIGAPAELGGLAAVTPPMSVWPYRPGAGWQQSQEALLAACLERAATLEPDLVLAGCGCYGAPMMADLRARLPGLTAIYCGQVTNTYFGIYTASARTDAYWQRAPTSPHWTMGTLEARYPPIARIDHGRYLGKAGDPA